MTCPYIDDQKKFAPEVLKAMKEFARSKPWQGTNEERLVKFNRIRDRLAEVYGVKPPALVWIPEFPESNGVYFELDHSIHLFGKLSVITFLHEFGHARFGRDEDQVRRWSINLFKRCFPKSFAKLQWDSERNLLVKS